MAIPKKYSLLETQILEKVYVVRLANE